MSGAQDLLLGNFAAAGGGGGYQIERSLRFNSADTAYLSRTPASAGNRKTWTWSGWVKRSASDTFNTLFVGSNSGNSDTTYTAILFRSDQLQVSGYNTLWRRSTALYRDFSAWYHVVVALDTTQATASNRVKMYVNGSQITDFAVSNDLTQNTDYGVNQAASHTIGSVGTGELYNGYMAEINFIDGQALTPSSFGQTNATTGVWEPIAYTGTYGTNGFYLQMANSSVVGQLYKSSTLYTTKADILANATAISGGASISSEYLYFVPNGSEVSGAYVFSNNGSLSAATRYFYRSGGSWVQTAGSYTTTEFTSMIFGSDSSTYQLSVSRDFYLLSSSSGQTTHTGTVPTLLPSVLIEDESGNKNSWGLNNFSFTAGVGNDSLVDTPTPYGTDTGAGGEVRGNYCVGNPLDKGANMTLANGNLQFGATGAQAWKHARCTMSVPTTDKWYMEYTITAMNSNSYVLIGFTVRPASVETFPGGQAKGIGFQGSGDIWNDGSLSSPGYTFALNDVVMFAIDRANQKVWIGKNGTWFNSGNPAAGTGNISFFSSGVPTTGDFLPAVGIYDSGNACYANFGQRPFAYTAPSGFKALVSQNLPAPTVVQGNDYFNTALYAGTSSTQSVTGVGFQPDFVWIKNRSDTYNHVLQDVLRGFTTGKKLASNGTFAQGDSTNLPDWAGYVSGVSSDGFTLTKSGTGGVDYAQTNITGNNYVAWNWKANGAGSSNTDGTITSTVSANTTAGFSIVTFTVPSSGTYTWGHGLGVTPSFVMIKELTSGGTNWLVYHSSAITATNQYLSLNLTSAVSTLSGSFGSALPTSTVVSMTAGTFVNASANAVAYCFAPIAGFSAFGSYAGNGSTDGPFIYTGFTPEFFMIKSSTNAASWDMHDINFNAANPQSAYLQANTTIAEYSYSGSYIDILSNGVKIRGTDPDHNTNGQTYIYVAFAQNPFKYALAR